MTRGRELAVRGIAVAQPNAMPMPSDWEVDRVPLDMSCGRYVTLF